MEKPTGALSPTGSVGEPGGSTLNGGANEVMAPQTEPNIAPDRVSMIGTGDEYEKGHTAEPEKVLEWGGPNNRYGKVMQAFKYPFMLLVKHHPWQGGLQGS